MNIQKFAIRRLVCSACQDPYCYNKNIVFVRLHVHQQCTLVYIDWTTVWIEYLRFLDNVDHVLLFVVHCFHSVRIRIWSPDSALLVNNCGLLVTNNKARYILDLLLVTVTNQSLHVTMHLLILPAPNDTIIDWHTTN